MSCQFPPPQRDLQRGIPRINQALAMLASPMQAPELVTALGVSKQSVHKLLKKLQSEGKVRRIPDPGLPSRQFWVSADVDFDAILKRKALALNASSVRVLSALQPASFHRIRDLANLLRMSFSTAQ